MPPAAKGPMLRPAVSSPAHTLGVLASLALRAAPLAAQDSAAAPTASVEVYGFLMADAIFDGTGINPDWRDAARPTQLPAYKDQYGKPGEFVLSVRQSRIGIKPRVPTSIGEIKGQFEVDMFGVGPDAGVTTIRLRHAFVEVNEFLFGQTHTLFMNIDMFPNSLDYWGPSGMVFVRLPQFRWTPIRKERPDIRSERDPREPRSQQRRRPTKAWLAFALEAPGYAADLGRFSDRPAVANVMPRYPLPDLTGQVHVGWPSFYAELGAVVGYARWDDLGDTSRVIDLSGDGVRWGFNLTSAINTGTFGTLRLGAAYGHGVENYWNDAPFDLAVQVNVNDPSQPIVGKMLPILGLTAFYDIYWNPKWTSTAGWSYVDIENANGQTPDAYRSGQYALANLLWHPDPSLLFGPEVQYIRRENFSDGFVSDGFRLQVSGKWNYSFKVGGT